MIKKTVMDVVIFEEYFDKNIFFKEKITSILDTNKLTVLFLLMYKC